MFTQVYDRVTEEIFGIVQTSDIDSVSKLLSELHDEHVDEKVNLIQDMMKDQEVITKKCNALIVELKESKKRALGVARTIKDVAITRQYINTIFNKLWNKYEAKICHLDYEELSKKYQSLCGRNINNKPGVKYALYVLTENYYTDVSNELCLYYLSINNKFHPLTNPITIVKESILHLKNDVENDVIPEYYKSAGISSKILSELEKLC